MPQRKPVDPAKLLKQVPAIVCTSESWTAWYWRRLFNGLCYVPLMQGKINPGDWFRKLYIRTIDRDDGDPEMERDRDEAAVINGQTCGAQGQRKKWKNRIFMGWLSITNSLYPKQFQTSKIQLLGSHQILGFKIICRNNDFVEGLEICGLYGVLEACPSCVSCSTGRENGIPGL